MAEQKERILLNLSINTDELTDRIVKAKKEILSLKDENKKLAAEAADALKKGMTASYEELSKKIVENETKLRGLNTEQRNGQKTLDLVTASNKAQAGSYEELLRQQQLAQTSLKLLEGTIKKNADGTIELTDEYRAAAKEVKVAKDAIIAFDQGISDGRTNVGNYASSIEDALGKTGLFSGALGVAREGFSGIRTGAKIAQEGFDLLNKGIGGSIDSVTKWFNITTEDNGTPTTVTSVTDALKDVSDETDVAKTSTAELGVVTKVTTGSGIVGFRALAVAIAATGIGLLLIAVAGLVALFTKTEKGAEAIERKFAALGAIVDVLIGSFVSVGETVVELFTKPQEVLKALTDYIENTAVKAIKGYLNVLAGIATFDWDRIKEGGEGIADGFSNAVKPAQDYAKKLSEAATNAEKLKEREQDLEDAYRDSAVQITANKNEIDRLLLSSKEKTKSDQEKIDTLQKAGRLESENLELQKKLAKEELAIKQAQNKELAKNKVLRDENLAEEVDLQIKLNNLSDESAQIQTKIKNREANTINEITRERIAISLSLLSDELKIAELKGEETISLKKSIAAREREAQLSADVSPAERSKIESEYQRKLIEIDAESTANKQKLREQAEDISLSFIKDARAREIAEESVGLERRLALIKGKTEEETALRETLIQQSSLRIVEIQNQSSQEALKKTLDGEEKRNSATLEQLDFYYEGRKRSLELGLATETLTQEQFNEKSQALNLEKILAEKQYLSDFQATRETGITAVYETEKTLIQNSGLDKELQDAELLALEESKNDELLKVKEDYGAKFTAINQKLNDTEYAGQLDQSKRILADAKKRKDQEFALEQARMDLAGVVVTGVKGLLEGSKQDSKAYVFFIRALGLAEIGINLQKELSAIAFNAEANPANVPTAGAFGISYVAIKSGIAITRASLAATTILAQKYEKGGRTGTGETIPLHDAINSYNPEFIGSIASGGRANKPILGLIGEKGPEEIFPTWMLSSPLTGPMISSLAMFRDTKARVLPFMDGGITAPSLSTDFGVLGGVESFKEAIRELKIVTIIQDVRDANDVVNSIETNANI